VRFFILVLSIGAGSIALQLFLSRRENRYLGLIMPGISFVMSFAITLTQPAMNTNALGFILIWLICNIPTVVYLLIYFACCETSRRKRGFEKMKKLDL